METILSGMRPTGKLHLGHLNGVLRSWLSLQQEHRCFFFSADWHALTTDYEKPSELAANTIEMARDWLAIGIDPERSTVFVQSSVMEHAELTLLLSMITPLGWLERNPTYKDMIENLQTKDLMTSGFLSYPVLMAADIIIYKSTMVPIGLDQLPHLEITREIVRRFNHLYGHTFPEPKQYFTDTPKLAGTDGRKMSKSYGNSIYLSDSTKEIEDKLKVMTTDTRRVRRTDPGDPKDCPVFEYHKIYSTDEERTQVTDGCTHATIGCFDCKKIVARRINDSLGDYRERRVKFENEKTVRDILEAGSAEARKVAAATMDDVRAKMNLSALHFAK